MRHDIIKKAIRYLIAALFVIIIYIYRHKLLNIFTPFIIGIIMAYLLYPITYYLEKRGIKRSHSIIMTFLSILLAVLILFWFLAPYVTAEINTFIDELPAIRTSVEKELNILKGRLRSIPGANEAIFNLYTRINDIFLNALKGLPDRLSSIFSSFLNAILSPIIAFYILLDRERIYTNFYLLIPEKNRKTVESIIKDIDRVIDGYIRGQFYINLFVASFTSIGLLIINVKLAVLLGILTGIFNFIPYFGPILAAIPTVIMALLDSPQKAIYALIIYLIVQQVESGILAPRILSENVGLHPLMVMFLLLLGQEFFGITGMLVSVPLAAVIRVILMRLAQI
ncbi:MAG: AI-2E family transporter [Thermoanaerobacteraceae bacterium]|nr:AI-2E family transporter [Thermoanaerobacteraceae bacterium]